MAGVASYHLVSLVQFYRQTSRDFLREQVSGSDLLMQLNNDVYKTTNRQIKLLFDIISTLFMCYEDGGEIKSQATK